MPDKYPSATLAAPSSRELMAGKPVGGPVSALCPGSGAGITAWFTGMPPLDAQAAWSVCGWVRMDLLPRAPTILMGFGDGYAIAGAQRFFVAGAHTLRFWTGRDEIEIGGPVPLQRWHHLAACFDGQSLHCYRDGIAVGTSTRLRLTRSAALIQLGPPPAWSYGASVRGRIMACTVWQRALTHDEIAVLAASTPSEASQVSALALRAPGGETPDRVLIAPQVGQRGLQRPQDRSTIPHPSREPLRKARQTAMATATARSPHALDLTRPWRLVDATGMDDSGAAISRAGWDDASWYAATVPGTVLTTLVDQGVYPDPLHGRNNLLIPDDLARRNWWYRCEFKAEANQGQPFHFLELDGINYHAQVWLNGVMLGAVTGAFIRGRFDVTALLRMDGTNVLAIRIWPPPHPGDPHEQSLLAGPGPNGGDMCYDGPTFFCTEGWDWLPGIRDRNSGIWQEVSVRSSGAAQIVDPQVITTLPLLPALTHAHIRIRTGVRNLSAQRLRVVVTATVMAHVCVVEVELEPLEQRTVELSPERFPQLIIQDPVLWWPNGMGEAALHALDLTITGQGGGRLDQRAVRFGIREFNYQFAPHLLVVVNGRRVMCKGGNWGMDDALKRVTRERLEPFVRLHREANLNMIRNWCGQSTHDVFFDLCDEYGIMVWNDFWMTTEGFNVDPLDAQLFLANADDAIKRHRNHPCIAVWCGRNEGVPPPYLNEHLGRMLQELDGTRHYQPSSRRLDLMESGPWAYMEAQKYATDCARGFNTELGLHSVPTAETMRAMLEPEDLWPPNDAWAYHDLHTISNGDAHSYLEAIASGYGNASGLDDFCRRAQMVNYVNHRAMFEAWNSKLFEPCSGLLLWMTHPSWPSVAWQIYANTYSTYASYFGVKKSCEPAHVQLTLPDGVISVINHGHLPLHAHVVTVRLHGLDGAELAHYDLPVEARAGAATPLRHVSWPSFQVTPVSFLQLILADGRGHVLSENFYWHAHQHEDLQHLQSMPKVKLRVSISVQEPGRIGVVLNNDTSTVAVMAELTLIDVATGHALLPAYASDNYVSLLPGAQNQVTITHPDALPARCALRISGWNCEAQSIAIGQST